MLIPDQDIYLATDHDGKLQLRVVQVFSSIRYGFFHTRVQLALADQSTTKGSKLIKRYAAGKCRLCDTIHAIVGA